MDGFSIKIHIYPEFYERKEWWETKNKMTLNTAQKKKIGRSAFKKNRQHQSL
jgi:hypothetical protein